jgi:hypothetical protein
MPKLYIVGIDHLLCRLDSCLIVGAFDDLGWARNVVGSVDKISAIYGQDGRSQLQQAGARKRLSATDAYGQSLGR